MSVLTKNGRVVTAVDDSRADIFVNGETVALIGRDLAASADRVIDASGRLVIPGGVDPHTHMEMPFGGTESSDTFETGTRAGAFGGTTCIVDFAIQSRGASTLAGLDTWHAKAAGKAAILREQKELGHGDFSRIPNGGPGVENRMSLIYHHGVDGGRIDINRFVEITSTAPARIFGMFPRKGTIAVGSDADIVIFDPQREVTISSSDPRTRHMNIDYSAYEGFQVRGFTETVLSRGRVIVDKDEYAGSAGTDSTSSADPTAERTRRWPRPNGRPWIPETGAGTQREPDVSNSTSRRRTATTRRPSLPTS